MKSTGAGSRAYPSTWSSVHLRPCTIASLTRDRAKTTRMLAGPPRETWVTHTVPVQPGSGRVCTYTQRFYPGINDSKWARSAARGAICTRAGAYRRDCTELRDFFAANATETTAANQRGNRQTRSRSTLHQGGNRGEGLSFFNYVLPPIRRRMLR